MPTSKHSFSAKLAANLLVCRVRSPRECHASPQMTTSAKIVQKHRFFGKLGLLFLLALLCGTANAQTLATGQITTNTYGTSVTLLNTELAPTLCSSWASNGPF